MLNSLGLEFKAIGAIFSPSISKRPPFRSTDFRRWKERENDVDDLGSKPDREERNSRRNEIRLPPLSTACSTPELPVPRCNSRVSAIIFLPRVNPTANHFGDLLAVAAILSAAGIVSVLRAEAALESLHGRILIYLPARFSASISLKSRKCVTA